MGLYIRKRMAAAECCCSWTNASVVVAGALAANALVRAADADSSCELAIMNCSSKNKVPLGSLTGKGTKPFLKSCALIPVCFHSPGLNDELPVLRLNPLANQPPCLLASVPASTS